MLEILIIAIKEEKDDTLKIGAKAIQGADVIIIQGNSLPKNGIMRRAIIMKVFLAF